MQLVDYYEGKREGTKNFAELIKKRMKKELGKKSKDAIEIVDKTLDEYLRALSEVEHTPHVDLGKPITMAGG